MDVHVKYHYDTPAEYKLEKIGGEKSSWVDVRAIKFLDPSSMKVIETEGKGLEYEPLDFFYIDLGFSMEMPIGYEGYVLPRSSLFKKYGLLQVNSMGIIDNAYKGDNDRWLMGVVALRSGSISYFERVGQFRVQSEQPPISLVEVEHLSSENRGGIGEGTKKFK